MTALAIPDYPFEVSDSVARRVIDRVTDLCNDSEVAAVIEREVMRLTKQQLAGFAAGWVRIAVDSEIRQRTRDAEMAAQKAYEESPEGQAERAAKDRQRAERDAEYRAEKEASDRRYREGMASAIWKCMDDYADYLHVKWTQELLDSPFALGDGRTVMWGDATVEDHRGRVAMLTKHAAGTLESASRHKQAIDDLESAGVQTLRELAS